MIELTAYMSLGLAAFNLIPLPPLDGSKVLFALMSDESYYKLMRYERYGGLVLMVLMMTGVLESLSHRRFRDIFKSDSGRSVCLRSGRKTVL